MPSTYESHNAGPGEDTEWIDKAYYLQASYGLGEMKSTGSSPD